MNPPDHMQCMCNVDGFDMLCLDWIGHPLKWHQLFHHCVFREYTVVGRRCPAHPASVPILHLTDIRTLWSQQFEIEILHCNEISTRNNATSCHPTGYVKKAHTHTSNLRALNERKTTHKDWNKDGQTKSEKKQKNDKKPKHGEIYTYVLRRTSSK